MFFSKKYHSETICNDEKQLEQENDWIVLVSGLIQLSIGMVFIIPGIIALKQAKLRKRK